MKFSVEKRSKYQRFIETVKELQPGEMVVVTKEENDNKHLRSTLQVTLANNGIKGVRSEAINGHINFYKETV